MNSGRGRSEHVDVNLYKCYEIICIEGYRKSNNENIYHRLRYPFVSGTLYIANSGCLIKMMITKSLEIAGKNHEKTNNSFAIYRRYASGLCR